MSSLRDALIIGAGPAGSGLAAALAALGWDVLLVEQDHLPHHKVCGEFLSPEAQASLQALGLYRVVAGLGPVPMTRASLISRRGLVASMALPGPAWGISRFRLDAALAEAAVLAGAELRTGTTATGIERAGQVYRVTLTAGRKKVEVAARAVIAACGRHSRPGLPPRAAANPDKTGVGIKCHYQGLAMPARVELYLFPGGYAGAAPVEGGLVNVCLLTSREAFSRGGKQVRPMLEAAARWNPALGKRLAGGMVLPETEAAIAPVDVYRAALPWDGVACVGDTAAMIPPLSGDGMAMALRSAELCAPLAHDFLRGRLTLAGWEDRYGQAWRQEFGRPLWVSRILQRALLAPGLGDGLIGLGRLAPFLARRLVHATRGRLRATEEVAPLAAQPER